MQAFVTKQRLEKHIKESHGENRYIELSDGSNAPVFISAHRKVSLTGSAQSNLTYLEQYINGLLNMIAASKGYQVPHVDCEFWLECDEKFYRVRVLYIP